MTTSRHQPPAVRRGFGKGPTPAGRTRFDLLNCLLRQPQVRVLLQRIKDTLQLLQGGLRGGLRVSEIIALKLEDMVSAGCHPGRAAVVNVPARCET